ncbi:TonB-dependent receptor [Brumicola pallidula]|uniref:TonB-dependent receptor n=1 Tax=Brumicola pallidula DSM 14239 = ACAM 615 TaxID=1121922 RepID=K6ZVV4_9ALTE|nr:TonB-dependent receptor [Glaciecola pallidula]GAC27455.1 TonB-dependent receptor [Glaciecola pallidula DSM 14239 = ACAM 615]
MCKNKNKFIGISPLALAIASLAYSASVFSMEQDPEGNKGLETITVTAQKREQSIQEVPLSVSAFFSDKLANMHVNDIGDLQSSVPNLTVHQGDAQNAVVYIRGVGQIDSLAFADPGVGIYLDDVYLGRAQGAFLDVFDVERIEVLRGPQGTLYGRNTMGGAIKYVTAKPSNELEINLELGIGTYAERKLKASISGPLTDKLSGSFTAVHNIRDGYTENTFNGDDDGDKKLTAWRSSWFYEANDDFSLTFAVDSSKNDPEHSVTPVAQTALFTGEVITAIDPEKVSANFNNLNDLSTRGTSLTATWNISDNYTVKSISAYRAMDYDANLDLDASPDDVFGVFVFQEQNQFSQEFQFNYLSDAFSVVTGLYYFNEHDVTESGLFGPVISLVTNSENDQDNTSYAAYTNVDYFFNEKLTLTAGLRYTKEEKKFSRLQQFYLTDMSYKPILGAGDLTVTDFTTQDTWSSVSPKIAVSYQFDKKMMFFGSVSKGFKSGGFNGRSNTLNEAESYKPENMWSYEMGLKSDFMDDQVRVNATIFRNDYEDLQLSSFIADDQGSFSALFTNAGKALINGLEFELTFAASEDLILAANLGLMDAKYEEYIGAGGLNIANERELVNTPKTSAQLSMQYDIDTLTVGRFTFVADASYRSKTYPTVSSTEILAQDGRTLLNLNINYFSPNEKWIVRLGIKNITDKKYISHGFDLSDSGLSQLAYFGAPRTVSLSANYAF